MVIFLVMLNYQRVDDVLITEFNEFFGMIMDHTEAIAVYQWHGYAAGLSILCGDILWN